MRHFLCILSCLCSAAALFLLLPAPAHALIESQRVKSNDAESNDSFGSSVGLSGNTAIIGAWHDDFPGKVNAGSAYIFRNNAGTWSQLDKLIASDALAGNSFGASVAISGNMAIVGSPMSAGGGAAYIFKDNGAGDWVQVDRISATGALSGDEFGNSVAIDGNTAVVGAWRRGTNTGAAYVFRDNGSGDWGQVGVLTANDGEAGDQLGVSVAISGSTALVGAWQDTVLAPPIPMPLALAGSVYVFQDAGGGWSQAGKLLPSDPTLAKRFGTSVAMTSTTAVIGADGDGTGASSAGAAYIFKLNGSVWQQQDKLVPSDPSPTGQFGYSVGINGNTAVVGANQSSVNGNVTGSAYLFRDNGTGAWNQIKRLTASDGQAGDFFGFTSAISGGSALVGSVLGDDTLAGIDAGAGYFYQVPGPLLAGDFNGDGKVDGADYTVWRNSSGQTGVNLPADGNGDNVVNRADYFLWKRNYPNMTATGSLASSDGVPEPVSLSLLVVACLMGTLARFRSARRHAG